MKKTKMDFDFWVITFLIILLVTFVFSYDKYLEKILFPSGVGNRGNYNLIVLTMQFLKIAVLSSLLSVIVGFLLGVFCLTPIGKDFREIIEKLATFFQIIPTIALLLFVVTVFGLGLKSALIVLVIQSVLPILFNTITGIENIPKNYLDVADGLGMTNWQKMLKVKLPLAFPIIITGIRIGVLICISISTLAFSTGSGGLGLLIQTGISTYNMSYVFSGTVPIVLIAIITDKILKRLQLKLTYN